MLKRHQLQRATAGYVTLLIASVVALGTMLCIKGGTARLCQYGN